MGAINYKTSDFITVGYNCNYIDYDDDFYNDDIQYFFDTIAANLRQEFFYYFHVTIEPGYYEGFSIDIKFNFPICVDGYEDKALAQKEITRIKAFLQDCINNYNCCAVYPGWCTGYADYKNSLQELDAAIMEMRDAVKNSPTWRQYNKIGA